MDVGTWSHWRYMCKAWLRRSSKHISAVKNSSIDGIFVSPHLWATAAGYLSFGKLMGDHRGLWMDLPVELLFGYNHPSSNFARARRLKLSDPRVVERICDAITWSMWGRQPLPVYAQSPYIFGLPTCYSGCSGIWDNRYPAPKTNAISWRQMPHFQSRGGSSVNCQIIHLQSPPQILVIITCHMSNHGESEKRKWLQRMNTSDTTKRVPGFHNLVGSCFSGWRF